MIDLEISHEEFRTIVNEKGKYEKKKEDIRTMKKSDELNNIKGKTTEIWVKIVEMYKIKKIMYFFDV